ncbi:hypothetical protein C9374_000602 [Naegleria lovaniensis]|uniref:USP domain-containing protein n=1 Tax=Naegleria lovaniensis TaxID=51637 RepID=A0AA88GZD4_NAELO|nr:uncharacterized protein C9374_000602 [Naegleria lovaniensis]KAG2388438.1 hypothetical protein C9374_000602 [Naegleria lovaniensis]
MAKVDPSSEGSSDTNVTTSSRTDGNVPPPPPSNTAVLFNSAVTSFLSHSSGTTAGSSSNNNNNSNTSTTTTQNNFVGLANQGATCYLNSLVQSLFHTPEFRYVIFKWRYDAQRDPSKERCIPYQLQRLFAYLTLSKRKAVPTTSLTKSFGWEQSDAFVQHDVQELNRLLFDAIDVSLIGSRNIDNKEEQQNGLTPKIKELTNFHDVLISDIYSGIMLDYIEAKDHRRESGEPVGRAREDIYMDLQLVVRSVSSVEEALDNYVKPELLEGNEQWICEELGNKKIDAIKGLKLKTLPYILTLHLKRFDYDLQTWTRIKLGNMVTFPYELDMKKYVTNQSGSHIYDLFAVLIHSGSALGGHYYAYIKSLSNGKWYNFNDSNVSEIDAQQVKLMYGTNDASATGRYSSSTNAYMLLYRKRDDNLNINHVEENMIPGDLREEVEKDNEQIAEELRKAEEARQSLNLRIKCEGQPVLSITVKKTDTMNQVLEKVHEMMSRRENFYSKLSNCRLRKFDIMKQLPTSSFHRHGDQPISRFNMFNGTILYLETKESDEEWKEITEYITIYVCPFNEENNDFDQPRSIKITTTHTLLEIKKEIEKELQRERFPHEKLNLVIMRNDQLILFHNVEENDRTIENGLNIVGSDLVYVETLDDPTQNLETKVLAKLDEMKYCFDVLINTFDKPNDYTTAVTVDKRKTVRDLKERIAKILQTEPSAFRLCTKMHMQPINEDVLISECPHIFEYTSLHVEKGAAPKEGEVILQLYVHLPWLSEQQPHQEKSIEEQTISAPLQQENGHLDVATNVPPPPDTEGTVMMTCEPPPPSSSTALVLAPKDGPVYNQGMRYLDVMQKLKDEFRFVDKIVVNQQETLGQFKRRIYEKYFSNPDSDQFVPLELMRLRTKVGVFLQNLIIHDDKTIKENIPDLTNNKHILVQIMERPMTMHEGNMIIYVQRWLPSEWKFYGGADAKFEVLIPKESESLSPQTLRTKIYETLKHSALSDVSPERFEQIGISRAPNQFDYFISKECVQVAILNYDEIDSMKDLYRPPFIIKQDDIFIVRLKDEMDKYDMEEYKQKKKAEANNASSTTRVQEKALKIKVLDKETEEKEQRLKEEEEQKKKESQDMNQHATSDPMNVDSTSSSHTTQEENPKKKLKLKADEA